MLSAYAQTVTATAQAGGESVLGMVVQFVVIMGILYLLLLRPQQKKVKKHMQILQSIKVGDQVLVNGIIGEVVDATERELTVRVAPSTDIRVLRLYVTEVLTNEKELVKKGK